MWARGRVMRASTRPPTPMSVITPASDSNATSELAVLPTACIAPVPTVVKTPILKQKARRKGSASPSDSVPARAVGPSPT